MRYSSTSLKVEPSRCSLKAQRLEQIVSIGHDTAVFLQTHGLINDRGLPCANPHQNGTEHQHGHLSVIPEIRCVGVVQSAVG